MGSIIFDPYQSPNPMRTVPHVVSGVAAITLALCLVAGCGWDQPKPVQLAPAGYVSGGSVSEPMQAAGDGFVRFRVRAEMAGSGPMVILRTNDGHEVLPLGGPLSVGPEWKTINFPAPAGPFRIVALGLGQSGRMEFTAPHEITRFSYIAGALAGSPIWPIVAAIVVFCGFWVI